MEDRISIPRLRELRAGDAGVALVLYLDPSDCILDAFMEATESTGVVQVDRGTSDALLELLISTDDGLVLSDEAGLAVSMMARLGEGRQAALLGMIQGFMDSRPIEAAALDPFEDYAETVAETRREEFRFRRLCYQEERQIAAQGGRLIELEGEDEDRQ